MERRKPVIEFFQNRREIKKVTKESGKDCSNYYTVGLAKSGPTPPCIDCPPQSELPKCRNDMPGCKVELNHCGLNMAFEKYMADGGRPGKAGKSQLGLMLSQPENERVMSATRSTGVNDENYISPSQKLLGKPNPKFLIPPVVVPPILDIDYWRTNNLVTRSGINATTPFDEEASGYVPRDDGKCRGCPEGMVEASCYQLPNTETCSDDPTPINPPAKGYEYSLPFIKHDKVIQVIPLNDAVEPGLVESGVVDSLDNVIVEPFQGLGNLIIGGDISGQITQNVEITDNTGGQPVPPPSWSIVLPPDDESNCPTAFPQGRDDGGGVMSPVGTNSGSAFEWTGGAGSGFEARLIFPQTNDGDPPAQQLGFFLKDAVNNWEIIDCGSGYGQGPVDMTVTQTLNDSNGVSMTSSWNYTVSFPGGADPGMLPWYTSSRGGSNLTLRLSGSSNVTYAEVLESSGFTLGETITVPCAGLTWAIENLLFFGVAGAVNCANGPLVFTLSSNEIFGAPGRLDPGMRFPDENKTLTHREDWRKLPCQTCSDLIDTKGVLTDNGYDESNLNVGLPTNFPASECGKSPATAQLNVDTFTSTIVPGVYQNSQIIEPINSNIGISFTQQIPPTTISEENGELLYELHDPNLYQEPEEELPDQSPNTANVYDPRFTGYGASNRSYNEPMTGQTRFYYKDVDCIRMPNYIVRSKIDVNAWADRYGPAPDGFAHGNPETHNIRTLANNAFLDATIEQRTSLMQSLMRKRNAELYQLRMMPMSNNLGGNRASAGGGTFSQNPVR